MKITLNILLVEDSASDAILLIRFLKKEALDFSHSRVWTKDAFIQAIKENDYDLIISDHTLPSFNGIEAFRIVKKENKKIPFIWFLYRATKCATPKKGTILPVFFIPEDCFSMSTIILICVSLAQHPYPPLPAHHDHRQ